MPRFIFPCCAAIIIAIHCCGCGDHIGGSSKKKTENADSTEVDSSQSGGISWPWRKKEATKPKRPKISETRLKIDTLEAKVAELKSKYESTRQEIEKCKSQMNSLYGTQRDSLIIAAADADGSMRERALLRQKQKKLQAEKRRLKIKIGFCKNKISELIEAEKKKQSQKKKKRRRKRKKTVTATDEF